ncbi:MAG: hypothetical protein HN623_02285 [Bdellovibrionales bacterium]|nr:hypothetical protein [Bdellovibrionales bacterium]
MLKLLAITVLLLTGLPNSWADAISHANAETECLTQAQRKIRALLEEDQNNILGKQYHLTALKLALVTSTLDNSSGLPLPTRLSPKVSPKELNKLLALYQQYGLDRDQNRLDQSLSEQQANLLFSNHQMSSFLLAHSLLEPKSPFGKVDAAIVWLMQEAQDALPKVGNNSSYLAKVNFSGLVRYYMQQLATSSPVRETLLTSYTKLKDQHQEAIVQLKNDLWRALDPECYRQLLPLACGLQGIDLVSDILGDLLLDLTQDFPLQSAMQSYFADDLQLRFRGKFDLRFIPQMLPPPAKKREMDLVKFLSAFSPRFRPPERFVRYESTAKFQRSVNQRESQEERVIAYHQFKGDGKEYLILDKSSQKLKLFNGRGFLVAQVPFDLGQRVGYQLSLFSAKGSGAGIYQVESSEGGRIKLLDQRGRREEIVGEAEELAMIKKHLAKDTPFYILPTDPKNIFVVKNRSLHFTTDHTSGEFSHYSYSPKDRKAYSNHTVLLKSDHGVSLREIIHPWLKNERQLQESYITTLDQEKVRLMELYHLDNDEYNQAVKMAYGILGNESEFGQGIKYDLKEGAPKMVSIAKWVTALIRKRELPNYSPLSTARNSRGLTQIKKVPKLISEKYGIKKSDLWRPKQAAIATLGFLAQSYHEVKALERRYPDLINRHNRFDFVAYIYQGKMSQITSGTATPESNLYLQSVKKYASEIAIIETR